MKAINSIRKYFRNRFFKKYIALGMVEKL